MCSVFRRRIAYQIISILKPYLLPAERAFLYDSIPLYLNLSQSKGFPPCFKASWKDIVKLNPDLNERVSPTSLVTYLRNQDFPTKDGIVNINHETNTSEKITFTANQEMFTSSVLLDICARIDQMQSTFFKSVTPENILVEYSSPNIAKPFHYGHFRSTIIGNFVANLYKYVGHDVSRINYVGDWGLQYGILAVGFNKFGSTEKLSEDPLGHLYEIYKEANVRNTENSEFNESAKNHFKLMEKGDQDALKQWKSLRDVSLQKIEESYSRLNIKFDAIHSESMYFEKAKNIINTLIEKSIAHKNDDGSVQVDIDEEKKQDSIVLLKSDGTTLYLTRDLSAAIDRQETYHFDSMYYVVDSAQSKHFQNLKTILKCLNYSWESCIHHVSFGRVLNFSTRKGTVVFLNDILNEAQERTLKKMHESPNTKVSDNLEEVADILGISSLIVNDFKCRRKKEVHFNWDTILSMTGDSGSSLQYCHARLCSIEENCGFQVNSNCYLNSLVETEAIMLIYHLAKFDEVIYKTYTSLEPCILVHYMFELQIKIGRAIKFLPVKGSNPDVARARLLLFHCSKLVLKKSFEILGVQALSKM